MRARWVSTFLAALCGAALSGCAGEAASSAPHAGAALPAALPAAAARGPAPAGASSAKRHTLGASNCAGSALGSDAFIGAGVDDAAPGFAAFAGAGYDSNACDEYTVVVGGYGNTIFSGTGTDNGQSFIGAGNSNSITGTSAYNSGIVGGDGNSIIAPDAFIGSGDANAIATSGNYSALVGGGDNTLNAEYGFIGAGSTNAVSGEYGVIGGGNGNTVSGSAAVIGGGQGSYAEGAYATVPGGYDDNAAGELSFAAGFKSYARYAGSFVWSDYASGATLLESTAVNQFLARATGGFTLWTNAANTVGATLAPGSGTWASASDRNLKTDVARIDDAAVLDKVAALPIERWSYKSERGVRHVGPMAQDFYAAFGVGEDDKHITSIDEDGVALAAIKALHAENARLRRTTSAQTAGLRAEVAGLRAEVAALRALVEERVAR